MRYFLTLLFYGVSFAAESPVDALVRECDRLDSVSIRAYGKVSYEINDYIDRNKVFPVPSATADFYPGNGMITINESGDEFNNSFFGKIDLGLDYCLSDSTRIAKDVIGYGDGGFSVKLISSSEITAINIDKKNVSGSNAVNGKRVTGFKISYQLYLGEVKIIWSRYSVIYAKGGCNMLSYVPCFSLTGLATERKISIKNIVDENKSTIDRLISQVNGAQAKYAGFFYYIKSSDRKATLIPVAVFDVLSEKEKGHGGILESIIFDVDSKEFVGVRR
jgi:hypothetical protein